MKNGYVALISVLIVGALAVAVTTGVLLLGLAWSQSSFTVEQSYQAMGLADACIEEALQQIADSTPFTGIGTLALGQGTCAYTVTNTGGQSRSVTSQGMVGGVVRKVGVTLNQIRPKIALTSWQEIP